MNKHLPLIPYFETSRYRVNTMVDLSKVKRREKVADLGSGDGRIAIAFAQKGASVDAFELDCDLVEESTLNIKKHGLENLINIKNENFWNVDLTEYDIVCIYPMPDIMEHLEEKLAKETQPGTRILINFYPLPNWEKVQNANNVFLYVKK